MTSRLLSAALAALILSACTDAIGTTGATSAVPEAVRELAAPYQDLGGARLRPEDGCYWYLHDGPVETTLLPVRTVDGRTICTRAQP